MSFHSFILHKRFPYALGCSRNETILIVLIQRFVKVIDKKIYALLKNIKNLILSSVRPIPDLKRNRSTE